MIKKFQFGSFKNLFWVLSLIVYAFSVYNTIFYYKQFGINVIPYFTITESILDGILLLLKMLLFTTAIFIVSFILSLISIFLFKRYRYLKKKIIVKLTRKDSAIRSYQLFTQIINSSSMYYVSSTLVIVIFLALFLILQFVGFILFDYMTACVFFIVFICFLYSKRAKKPLYKYFTIIMCPILVLVYLSMTPLITSSYVKNNEDKIYYRIHTLDDICFNPDEKDMILIGETNSAVFLYDKEKGKSVIINRLDIRRIELSKQIFFSSDSIAPELLSKEIPETNVGSNISNTNL